MSDDLELSPTTERPPLITAIPTTYRGTRMRSRLEARWAAMFDAMGWPWLYEPFDLEGYIPDFVIQFHRPLLVDVKPALSLEESHARCNVITATIGWAHEILVLGAAVPLYACGRPCVGSLAVPEAGAHLTTQARAFRCISCGMISVLSEEHGWACRACGAYDGNGHVGEIMSGEIEELWAAAGNRVQWRPV